MIKIVKFILVLLAFGVGSAVFAQNLVSFPGEDGNDYSSNFTLSSCLSADGGTFSPIFGNWATQGDGYAWDHPNGSPAGTYPFGVSGDSGSPSMPTSLDSSFYLQTGLINPGPTGVTVQTIDFDLGPNLTDAGFSLSLNGHSTIYPLGTDISSLGLTTGSFDVRLYVAGTASSYIDNIAIDGVCGTVPEPSGAMLLASAGALGLVRRRRR